MIVSIDTGSIDDYRLLMKIKRLPVYRIQGREVWFPDEYAHHIGIGPPKQKDLPIDLAEHLFDYQRAGAELSIRKRKFAHFWRPGLGKTNALFEHVRHARKAIPKAKRCLIVSPLMVIDQTLDEATKFYPNLEIEQIKARDLKQWLHGEGGIGITNYEALTDDLEQGNLGCLELDESSLLKSHYGKWGQVILRLGKGVDWKLCLTGTPAPNDRVEFANHAVFLDHHPNVNSFLAKYFVNRGETSNRWELKPHALKPFYTGLSHWSLFINEPKTYGFVGCGASLPPIHVHINDYELTKEQLSEYQALTGNLCVCNAGGIGIRQKMSQIAKGTVRDGDNMTFVPTAKYDTIKKLVSSWPNESTIIWCRYNPEQERMSKEFPDAASIDGTTPHDKRQAMIREFKSGKTRVLITKPKIAQFGLNLQIVTRHVWSTLQDSWEEFWQGCCRSNRVGSTKPLDVHIPINELERPMIETVLSKADRINKDMEEQEAIFKKCGLYDFRVLTESNL